jgi:multiple sugar transport system substrate-binding protein
MAGLAAVYGGNAGASTAAPTKTARPAAAATLPKPVKGSSITIDYHYPPPPKAVLNEFTKQTGVKVNWVEVGWDPLQVKIATAMESNSYFADLTDVDWSKVGEYYKTQWFYPLNSYFNLKSLSADMPQLTSFSSHGHQYALPFDAGFTVTTWNATIAKKAGIKTIPTTLTAYTNDLKQIKAKGVLTNPLDIPFAAAEGLSTYWYQLTASFGGEVLNASYKPQISSPSSAGYKALAWMVNAYKTGLVPKANINDTDYGAMTSEMAEGRVASVFSDYSGNVGSLYDVPSTSKVVGQVEYAPVPGVSRAVPDLSNPDGIGIPKTAKNVAGALAFINWFTNPKNQAIWAGLDGPADVVPTFGGPARLSSMEMLAKTHLVVAAGEREIIKLFKTSRAEFPGPGAPPWYPQFSNAVYTNIHEAAAGAESVKQAVSNITNEINQLRTSS